MTMESAIKITNLSVSYRNIEALRGINLQLKAGRLTGIIGPNGAGKSTLLKAILGLINISNGDVLYKSKSLINQRKMVAYVPQRTQIDWTYPATVLDVVMMGRISKTGWFRGFSNVSKQKVLQALEKVEMTPFVNRPIGQLSGGQQQRVFLARSLAQEAEIFCFDEPFVGVDQRTETIIFNIFQELVKDQKIVLVVNHDLGESITNFDDLILLNKELIAAGERQEVLQEKNLYQAYSGKVMFFNENDYNLAA